MTPRLKAALKVMAMNVGEHFGLQVMAQNVIDAIDAEPTDKDIEAVIKLAVNGQRGYLDCVGTEGGKATTEVRKP